MSLSHILLPSKVADSASLWVANVLATEGIVRQGPRQVGLVQGDTRSALRQVLPFGVGEDGEATAFWGGKETPQAHTLCRVGSGRSAR